MDEELVAYQRKMLREDGEQMDHGFVLFGADDAGLEVGFLQFAQIHLPTPVGELLHWCGRTAPWSASLHEDLPRLEEAEQFVANGDGDAGVAKARETFHRARAAADLFGDLLLGFGQARRRGCLRHDDAKGIFGFLAVMGTLPRLDRAQAEGRPVVLLKARS